MMPSKNLTALKAAFPHTIPVLTGFLFLGITYGIYMNSLGLDFWWSGIVSLTVYAGSAQFVLANLLVGTFEPLQAFLMIFILNMRHIFYGVSMLEKYKGMGWKKPFLLFWMSDETFSVNYSAKVPENVDKGSFMFFVSMLDYSYWFCGSVLGGLFGKLLIFDTTGIDFVMTAMFIVIFLEQLLADENKISNLSGLTLSLCALIIFGKDSFVLPAMAAILGFLTLIRPVINKKRGEEAEK